MRAAAAQLPPNKNAGVPSFGHQAPRRDPNGLNTIQKALVALGDPAGQLAAESCDISATVTSPNQTDTKVEWLIEPHNYLVTAHRSAGVSQMGSRTPLHRDGTTYNPSERLNRAFFVPAALPVWLARAMNDPEMSISEPASEMLSGKSAIVLVISNSLNMAISSDGVQRWYLNPDLYLPEEVDFKVPSLTKSGIGLPERALITGYQSFADGLFPSEIWIYQGSTKVSTVDVTAVRCSSQLHSDSYFNVTGASAQ